MFSKSINNSITNGKQIDNTIPAPEVPPPDYHQSYVATNQAINHLTNTTVSFWDDDITSTNITRVGGVFTVSSDGYYQVSTTLTFSPSSVGVRDFWVQHGGIRKLETILLGSATVSCVANLSGTIYMVSGENITVNVFQDRGSQLNLTSGYISIIKLL